MSERRGGRGDEASVQARRAQILNAATRVFALKGFQRATIREIAAEAGLADGTIYLYFVNKAALLLGILDRINESERRDADLTALTGADFAASMREYMRRRLATVTDVGLDTLRVLLSEVFTDAELGERYYREIIAPTLALAEATMPRPVSGDVPLTDDTRLALRAVAGMTLGVLMLRLLGDPLLEARWDEVPDLLADFIVSGLIRPDVRPEGGSHERDHDTNNSTTDPAT